MARADLLTDLVRFALAGDKVRFRKVVEAIIAEERAKQEHHRLGLLRSYNLDARNRLTIPA
ncbi:MAG: hypothetical protein ISN29_00885 [Gammaproteobacteria bacterium AqS3]|nr:hypothetical protein [Gammaproteobacteria bacterium AqS3]